MKMPPPNTPCFSSAGEPSGRSRNYLFEPHYFTDGKEWKKCNTCGDVRGPAYFYQATGSQDGKAARCVNCVDADNREIGRRSRKKHNGVFTGRI